MRHEQFYLYENRDDVTLMTYLLDDSPELLHGKRRPGILVCPGGGYLNCSDREAEPIAIRLASMGYHTFVLRYSVYSEPGEIFPVGSAALERRERSIFPASMRDIGKAFLLMRKYADEWLLDADRIALCGFSAGAHNSAMYATSYDGPDIAGFYQVDASLLRPAVVVLGYGLYDYHLVMSQLPHIKDPFAVKLRSAACMALLGTVTPSNEQLEVVSPARKVTADTPPMFLWATGEDALVPIAQSASMCLALASKGVPFESHLFESGPHGLSLADQASASSLFEMNQDAAKWMPLLQAWLEKRFALPLRETPHWMGLMSEDSET